MLNRYQYSTQGGAPSNNGGNINASNHNRPSLPPRTGNSPVARNGNGEDEDEEQENAVTAYPYFDLPLLNIRSNYLDSLPEQMKQFINMAHTEALADSVFLTLLTLMGFTVCRQLRFRYNNVDYHAAPMLIFCAPPATGKGLIGEMFHLLDEEDERRRKIYEEEMAIYKQKMDARNAMGKSKVEVELPEKPKLFMAKIAADNSASGLLENIFDAGGTAALLATEINELAESTQRKGCGDPTTHLCKAWGHEYLFMNRRTDDENLLVKEPIVPTIYTGTPPQLKGLIRNPGNGFFTRCIYYHIPISTDWQNVNVQTVENANDDEQEAKSNKEKIKEFSKAWEAKLHKKFDSVSDIRLLLTNTQLNDYNMRMKQLNDRAADNSIDMVSYVHRLGSNIMRMCLTLALVRALESESNEKKLLTPRKGTNNDNIKDGITPLLDLHLLDSDYEMMMSMLEPLYMHSMHTLSILDKEDTISNHAADREVLWNDLPEEFTYELAYSLGRIYTPVIKERTIRSWVKSYIDSGALIRLERSAFRKKH